MSQSRRAGRREAIRPLTNSTLSGIRVTKWNSGRINCRSRKKQKMDISLDSDTSLADRVYLALDDGILSGQITVNGRVPTHLQRASIKAMQKPLEILNDENL